MAKELRARVLEDGGGTPGLAFRAALQDTLRGVSSLSSPPQSRPLSRKQEGRGLSSCLAAEAAIDPAGATG